MNKIFILLLLLVTNICYAGVTNITDAQKIEAIINHVVQKEISAIPKPREVNLSKGEFETISEFNSRVERVKKEYAKSIEDYKAKVAQISTDAKYKGLKVALDSIYGKPYLSGELTYDAESQNFFTTLKYTKTNRSQSVAIYVPRGEAKNFKYNAKYNNVSCIYSYENGVLSLKDIKVTQNGKSYVALFSDTKYQAQHLAINVAKEINIDTNFNTSIKVGSSDVGKLDGSKVSDLLALDRLLDNAPQATTNPKAWLFVVGIEKYEFTDNIAYAKRSAEMFARVAQKTLGVPKENSFVLIDNDASQAKIKTGLKMLARKVEDGDTIYFYYNGHGVPIPQKQNEPFMLASDSSPDYIADEADFSLQNIYLGLSSSKASKVVAFVDSCFSGVTDGKAILKGVAATRIKPKTVEFDKEKMVVLTAGKDTQYSNAYNQKAHRMFSYFVMKHILDGKRDIKSLFNETRKATYETSQKEYGDLRAQEPTVDGNIGLNL